MVEVKTLKAIKSIITVITDVLTKAIITDTKLPQTKLATVIKTPLIKQ